MGSNESKLAAKKLKDVNLPRIICVCCHSQYEKTERDCTTDNTEKNEDNVSLESKNDPPKTGKDGEV